MTLDQLVAGIPLVMVGVLVAFAWLYIAALIDRATEDGIVAIGDERARREYR